MNAERLPSGVRAFHGDNPVPFSERHRTNLGRGWYKMDLDHIEFVGGPIDSEASVFHGYVVADRRFATVSVFDLKKTHNAILSSHNIDRHMYQVSLCLSLRQPVPPVFAYVVGDGPFEVYRVDLSDGSIPASPVVLPVEGRWEWHWDVLGLTETRKVLHEWLVSE